MARDSGCKVDRVVADYGLGSADPVYDDFEEGLLARWTGAGEGDAMGYRSLTDWFNRRLLKRVNDDHGRDSLGARLDAEYEALAGDDDLLAREVIESLRADGVDGEALRDDMVSWGTMRTHLTECLDGRKAPRTATTDWERESVARATAVAERKAREAASALASKGDLAGGDGAEVGVAVHLGCDDCPTRVPFEVAVERGYVCERHHATATGEGREP
jgi:hypothetical protein